MLLLLPRPTPVVLNRRHMRRCNRTGTPLNELLDIFKRDTVPAAL